VKLWEGVVYYSVPFGRFVMHIRVTLGRQGMVTELKLVRPRMGWSSPDNDVNMMKLAIEVVRYAATAVNSCDC
jgi:hypothetical protein